MKPPRWKIEIAASGDESKLWALGQKKSLHHYVGWKSEMFRPQERCFFLTSPFIELFRDDRLKGKKPSSRNAALNNPMPSYLLRGTEAHVTRSRFSRNKTARIDRQKKTCVGAI
jgi:hypothetical protein